jgi:hypothetical protein
MDTYNTELELLDLEPYRMPTDILEEIDTLSKERRELLQQLSANPIDSSIKTRLAEIEDRLEELWNQRRMELRRTG